jgi:aspartyl protease family protein
MALSRAAPRRTATRRAVRIASAVALAVTAGVAGAATVSVVGMFPGKAVLAVDGGAPRTLAPGQKAGDGVTLVGIAGDGVTLEMDGQRRTLRVGETWASRPHAGGSAGAPAPAGGGSQGQSIAMAADSAGHYVTVGAINDRAVKFFVDTGASLVWMSAEIASRIGIDYRNGRQFTVGTAGGPKNAYSVQLASVRVGSIVLTNVEAAVGEGAGTGDTVLLGMSFLSRLSMARDGNTLRLSQRLSEAASGDAKSAGDGRPRVTLSDKRAGLFATQVMVNDVPLPFLVDTGATVIALDVAMAQRIGLNYQAGQAGTGSTANGPVRAWRVKLDRVSIGPITLYNVDASVLDGPGIGAGLLGMSFLNRVEMQREGEKLVLIKRF